MSKPASAKPGAALPKKSRRPHVASFDGAILKRLLNFCHGWILLITTLPTNFGGAVSSSRSAGQKIPTPLPPAWSASSSLVIVPDHGVSHQLPPSPPRPPPRLRPLFPPLRAAHSLPPPADAMHRGVLVPALALLLLLLVSPRIRISEAHEGHGEGEGRGDGCGMSPDVRVVAEFRPGVVTVDGHGEEWADVDAFEFPLLPALDFDEDKAYAGGKMAVKALHDGNNMFFLLQVDGEYTYTKGDNHRCPSVALMFQIGENATYSSMGGCRKFGAECNSISCQGYEVDIMHFSIGKAIPGRLYGSNPMDNQEGTGADRFGHLVDLYGWNPHCRYTDGKGPAGNDSSSQNDWQGAWWHSAFTLHSGFVEKDSPYAPAGQKGTYYFEFSRPLRTRDRLQQDVQFTIGQASKVAVAFWYPDGGKPWANSAHYSVSCDWLPMDIISAASSYGASGSKSSWDAASAFSLILSGVAFGISVFVAYWVSKVKSVPFTPIDRL